MKILDKRKFIGTIFGLLIYSAFVILFTYAWYEWRSEDTNVVFTIEDGQSSICEPGPDVNVENIGPVLDYNDGVATSFQVENKGETPTNFSVQLNITSISDSLLTSSFKYILLKGDYTGNNYEPTNITGDFSEFQIGTNTISNSVPIESKSNHTYKLMVYIDGNEKNDYSMMQSSMNAELFVGNCGDIGLIANGIPITLSESGTDEKSVTIYLSPGVGYFSDANLTNPITKISELPTKTGNTFTGYPGLTDEEGNITASNTAFTEPTTVEATWKINTYNVLFHGNGGTITNGSTLTNLVTNGSFENGTTSWTLSNTSVVDTHKYTGNKSLKFSANTTSSSSQTLKQTVPTLNNQYYGRIMFLSDNNYTVSDCRFEWYYTDTTNARLIFGYKENDTGGNWKLLSSIKTVTEDTYLSNNWKLRNFTVNSTQNSYVDDIMIIDLTSSFGNGNEINDVNLLNKIPYFENSISVKNSSYQYGTTYGNLPTPTREGYTFDGWYSNLNGSGTKITSDTIMSDNNIIYYAKWNSKTITIEYEENGGTGTMDNSTYAYGDTIKLSTNTFTKTGNTFDGWIMKYNDKFYGCTQGITCDENNSTLNWYSTTGTNFTSYYKISDKSDFEYLVDGGTIYLYAMWKANTYNVLFHGNGGTITGGKTLTNLVTNGSFENGTTGWSLSNATIVNTYKNTGSNSLMLPSSVTAMSMQQLKQTTPTLNNLYYGRTMFLSESGYTSSDNRFEWYYTDVTNAQMLFKRKNKDTNGIWEKFSGINQIKESTYLGNSWNLRNFTVNSTKNTYVDDVMVVDLTATFGSGNEITNLSLLDSIPYFDNSISILNTKIEYDSTFGTLPVTTKDGYIFGGWYTEVSGGTNVTNTTLFKETSDKILYAHYGNVSLEATKMNSGTKVTSGSWSDEGLNYTITRTGSTNFKIYYCKDTNNTCNPTTLVTSNTKITIHNTETGTYYIRYKIATDSGITSDIYSYTAKVDISTPILSMTSGSYELTNSNNVYSVSFGNSSGSVSCYNTSRSNANVTTYASIGTLGSNTITCTATSGAGKRVTESATFSMNWTVASERIYATGTAYKSGTSVIVPNGGTQYGPYIPTNQGCYQVVYIGSNLNKYYNGFQAYYNGTSLEMTRLNYIDTDANYFIKVPSNIDTLETVLLNNSSYDITVSTIRITHQGDVNSCPDAYSYNITLDQQGATTSGTTSVTASYLGDLPTISKLPQKNYTVNYNGNGGTVITSSTATYKFNGYYSGTNGSGTKYYDSNGTGTRTYNINGNSTFYASWSSSSITLATPTRSGYAFLGWYDSSGNYIGAAGASYTPTNNITLVASWIEAVWHISSSGTYQNTLANAINAASSTDTLTLQKDKEDNTGTINKNLTINTNGKTWTRNAVLNIDSSATFNLTGNGTISSTNNSTLIANYGNATINHTGTITTGDIGLYNLGIMYINNAYVIGTATTARPTILNTGQLSVNNGIYSSVNGICLQNGYESVPTGTSWITGGKFLTTGTGTAVIKNFSDEKWPTASTSGKIHYCSQACTIHIGGITKISNTGSKYAIQNQAINYLGLIHFPNNYTGYIHAKNNYVIRAYQGDVVMNGGNVYAEANKEFSSAGDNAIINWQNDVNIVYGQAPPN